MNRQFKTKEEIEEYFSGDRIQCLICDKWYKTLSHHLDKIHNMSVDDYKLQFGLPWSRGLICKTTLEKYQNKAEILRSKGLLLTGIVSKDHEKKVHKKGHRRITPLHSKFLSNLFKELGGKNAHQHLDMDKCKELSANGMNQIEIGNYFGVSQMTISRFMRKENKYQHT